MKLYYYPGACSLAPHIVAREAGLPIQLDKVDLLGSGQTESGQTYSSVNPRGYVPALALDDGTLMTEVSALIQYLGEKAPQAGLIPAAGSADRYKMLEWIGFISTEVHKGFSPLWNPATPDDIKKATVERLYKRFATLDAHLKGRSFLVGDKFSVADAYAFTVVSWANMMKLDLSSYPNLTAFLARVAARPKVQEAMRSEGLLSAAA